MDQAKAFSETMEDLRHRCRVTATEYDVIQASGLLRRLLCDQTPLGPMQADALEQVPVFRWMGVYKGDTPGLLMDPVIFDELGYRQFAGDEISDLSVCSGPLEKFLEHTVHSPHGGPVTVRRLVKHYANKEGGVHYGQRDHGHLSRALEVPAVDQALRDTLVAVGRIVYRAYESTLLYSALDEHRIRPVLSATVDDAYEVDSKAGS